MVHEDDAPTTTRRERTRRRPGRSVAAAATVASLIAAGAVIGTRNDDSAEPTPAAREFIDGIEGRGKQPHLVNFEENSQETVAQFAEHAADRILRVSFRREALKDLSFSVPEELDPYTTQETHFAAFPITTNVRGQGIRYGNKIQEEYLSSDSPEGYTTPVHGIAMRAQDGLPIIHFVAAQDSLYGGTRLAIEDGAVEAFLGGSSASFKDGIITGSGSEEENLATLQGAFEAFEDFVGRAESSAGL